MRHATTPTITEKGDIEKFQVQFQQGSFAQNGKRQTAGGTDTNINLGICLSISGLHWLALDSYFFAPKREVGQSVPGLSTKKPRPQRDAAE